MKAKLVFFLVPFEGFDMQLVLMSKYNNMFYCNCKAYNPT